MATNNNSTTTTTTTITTSAKPAVADSATLTLTTNAPEIRSLKELVDAGLRRVPDVYVRPPGSRASPRPTAPAVCETVPVVRLYTDGPPAQHIVRQVREACSEWGAFHITDHGIGADIVDAIWAAASGFFALPADEKLGVNAPSGPLHFFTGFYRNERMREWKDTLGFKPSAAADMRLIPGFLRDPILEFHKEVGSLARVIGRLLSASLQLDEAAFDGHFTRQTIGMNYYPKCPQPELAMGLSSHSDFGSITLLMQDAPGLQVKKGNDWIDVEVRPRSFVVLLGDQIEIATNGSYKSVEHRVLASSASPRMSIGCFYGPADSDAIGPMPAFVADGRPSVYKDTVFRDYLAHGFGKELDGKSNLRFCLLSNAHHR